MDKQNDLIRMTVHGLTVDNGFVRADVFADKIKFFVQAVKAADSALNKSPKFSLMIKQLKIGSAEAYLDPKQIKRAAKVDAPAPLVAQIASSIQGGALLSTYLRRRLLGSCPIFPMGLMKVIPM